LGSGAPAGRRFLPRGKLPRLTWKPQQKSEAEASLMSFEKGSSTTPDIVGTQK